MAVEPDRRLRLAIAFSLAAHAAVGAWIVGLPRSARPPGTSPRAAGADSEVFAVTRLAPTEARPAARKEGERDAPVAAAPPAARRASIPAANGAATGATANASAGSAVATADYVAELRARIEARKTYPRAARLRRQSGRVEVSFVVAKRDGEIRDVRLAAPSPYPALNEAALAAVREVARYRPVPDALALEDWPVVIALDFVLGGENRGPEDEP